MMKNKHSLQLFTSKIFFWHNETDRLLACSILFSTALTCFRTIHTGHLTFIFLLWNLFLAWVPYCISQWLLAYPQTVKRRFIFIPALLAWLAFIPNTFYMLTDLYHLGDAYNDYSAPDWFDLAMILSFAWNGLLLGILSVSHIEKLVKQEFSLKQDWLLLYPVMWMNALGIYVGRYLRFNSWDLLSNPFHLLRDIAYLFMHPVAERYATGMICCFSVLMTLIYMTLKKLGKTFL